MGEILFSSRWPDFKPEEVLSPIGLRYYQRGELLVQPHALDFLQSFRQHVGKPLLVNHLGLHFRGYRHPEENKKVGGTFSSYHMQGVAFDVTIKGVSPSEVGEMARSFGWVGIGIYPSFTHMDVRAKLDGGVVIWKEGLAG